MNRIDTKFRELRKEKKAAFIPFLTVGYPGLRSTERLVFACAEAGADIVELGVPFSDPIADGPVIQMASEAALKNGVTLARVFELVRRLRRKTQLPLAAMTYFNLILAYPPLRFIRDATASGLDAVIIPDLPAQEETVFLRAAEKAGLHVILFVAPTTSSVRLRFIARRARGFIYFVSLTGVTGARRRLAADLKAQLCRVKRAAGRVPVCVGFGISSPDQARFVARHGDGVIVGSALVREIARRRGRGDMIPRVARFVARLARACHG